MPRVDIFLKSGNIVTLDVEELTVTKNVDQNKVTQLSWQLADGAVNSPLYIRLEDISAVIEAR